MNNKQCVCKRCSYKWEPRVKEPKSCPECKSRDWREAKKLRGAA